MPTFHVLGFDPGGDKAFGWAVLSSIDGKLELSSSGTCSNAQQALEETQRACPSDAPAAFGVDAPLFWIPAGDRNADNLVRKLVCAAKGSSGTVSHVNSLRGACLVQGVLIASMAAKAWPEAQITEAHPKALLRVSSEAQAFANTRCQDAATEHERDAALAAFSAMNLVSLSEGWHDLVKNEHDPHFPIGKHVSYWFPQARA